MKLEEQIKQINYDETDYRFENTLASICLDVINKRDKASDLEFEKGLWQLLDDHKSDDMGYKAFFCLNIFYRYKKRLEELDSLINDYKNVFNNHESFMHLRLLSSLASKKNLAEFFKIAHEIAKKHCTNAGDLHLFSDIVITQYEIEGKFISLEVSQICDYWLDEAEKMLEQAIKLKGDYAKFYCTKARLLALRKDYSNALLQISRAIDLEDEANELKISHYHFIRMTIFDKNVGEKIKKNEDNINKLEQKNEEKMKDIMHKTTAKSYEIMAFFIGIISFIIASVNISTQLPAKDAIFVLLAFLGALLCAFYCLGFILNASENRARAHKLLSTNNIPLFLGILLIIGALLLCFLVL